jgi:hypothetical protein
MPTKSHESARRARGQDKRGHEGARLSDLRARQEALLDQAVQETFPASDPISVMRLF